MLERSLEMEIESIKNMATRPGYSLVEENMIEKPKLTIINPERIRVATGECRGCGGYGGTDPQPHPQYEIDPQNPTILIRKGSYCDPCLEKIYEGGERDVQTNAGRTGN